MRIPIASAEPDDLVSVPVDDVFSIEFRVGKDYGGSIVRDGVRSLVAYATVPELAAVRSLTDEVDLLQRRPIGPGAGGKQEPIRHPHGWAFMAYEAEQMHYFQDTRSVCEAVVGYAGLCYPYFDQRYFPWTVEQCPRCLAALAD